MQRGIAWIVDDDSSIRWDVLNALLTGAGLKLQQRSKAAMRC